MPELVLTAEFKTKRDFLDVFGAEMARGGLLIRNATASNVAAMSNCTVQFRIEDAEPFQVEAQVAAWVPGVGVAVVFSPSSNDVLRNLSKEYAATSGPAEGGGEAEEAVEGAPTGTIAQRLRDMPVAEKMQLALSADRDTRFALLRDTNKALHIYVLRNPRLGIDEVQFAAKLSTLSPDALKFIAEHKEWGLNSTICTALVRNPKLPVPLAIKLLGRIPSQEVRAIAKGGARQALVVAARKLVNG